ncbi:di-trans,poly-cis-decaprenylcistransferase [Candidatus Nomurabacteria bacterium]|uniref:Isoprenyl transferase n=1 Tax=Candidatus Dojkabacteria bacterium TaxID=2099670 RepID=A0A955I1A7_9BACT|nr:di-trans,poly-cis-decaprenylcistransferase [Candidatus Dojkabacteria bacterium]MCB9789715.1 di-trans,poly-cis-decaprenylcistransferase [Candidatus Nomurabacteria bacterium]MCB9803945.1 di-trans,poly-cis-decaprenylcistransferase [Candidatus Nomurabacteria bacterium]
MNYKVFSKNYENSLRKEYQGRNSEYSFGTRAIEGGPSHVAIICDGNRRWANENGVSVEEGHAVGAENVMRLVERAGELGIKTLTVWVMDTKNFKKRSKSEIRNLIKLFLFYAMRFKREYLSEDIRFRHLGARELLPKRLQKIIRELEQETAHKQQATLNVAFNYGGRDELVRMVKKIVEDGVDPADIDVELLSNYLDTKGQTDPDMIIRTGKDQRLSGFMPWQSEPSELFFPNYYFPEFTPDRFEEVVKEFPSRNRRFGA